MTPHRAASRHTSDHRMPESAIGGHVVRAGAYLTDGVFLYRVAGVAAGGTDDVVDLEDCYRLDVVRVPGRALRARHLRVVTPAG